MIGLLTVLSVVLMMPLDPAHSRIITGHVLDRDTGAPLPAANIQILGTFSGTISNDDGEYLLRLDRLPATLLFRYIGYLSKELVIDAGSDSVQDVFLEPTVLQAEPILIIGEDPAMGIMRKVIHRKQSWQPLLKTFIGQAYTRLLISNDSGIVSISESTSEVFWDQERSHKEIIRSKHQTSNINSTEIFASSLLPNFYDDDIELQGFDVVGITHPDALKYYDFKLEGKRYVDDDLVYDISLNPKSRLQPTLIGHIAVLDEEFALLSVDVKLNPAMPFPFPIKEWDATYQQQFNDFEQSFRLPIDVRIEGHVGIGIVGLEIPRIGFKQISRLSDYQVNVMLPDSLYETDETVRLDSTSVAKNSSLVQTLREIPLSEQETAAYAGIDSTMTLEKAFKPTGFLARFSKVSIRAGERDDSDEESERDTPRQDGGGLNLLKGWKPQVWHNRVDAFHLGFSRQVAAVDRLTFTIAGAYNTGPKQWMYRAGCELDLGGKSNLILSAEYLKETKKRQHSDLYDLTGNSIRSLFGFDDYFDYYRNTGFSLGVEYRLPPLSAVLGLRYHDENHESVVKITDYNLWGRDHIHPENPSIDEGHLRSSEVSLEIGGAAIPWGVMGQRRLSAIIEHSKKNLFGSDFDFTLYCVRLDWRQPTFFTRRPLPNVLDFRIVAGTATGTLPIQRFGALDTSWGALGPFGVFKTISGRPLEGESYLGLYCEHNFRTIPFEILGLQGLVDNGIGIILHGASGRTWISEDRLSSLSYSPHYNDEFHHEIGLSLNGIFGMIRIDITKPLGANDIFGGLSLARMF